MTEEPTAGAPGPEPRRHTPEEEQAFRERIETMAGFGQLAEESVDPRVERLIDRVGAEGTLEERQEVRHWVWHRWYLIPILVLIAILIAVVIFYSVPGEDVTAHLEGTDEAAGPTAADMGPDSVEDWVADNLEALSSGASAGSSASDGGATPGAAGEGLDAVESWVADNLEAASPAADRFAGTIVSENGWFTILVLDDGTVSGMVDLTMEVSGGHVVQEGSYSGTIDEDNVITCSGRYRGISVDHDGVEYPHGGTVTVTARPVGDGLEEWEITADGDPGDMIVLPAHSL